MHAGMLVGNKKKYKLDKHLMIEKGTELYVSMTKITKGMNRVYLTTESEDFTFHIEIECKDLNKYFKEVDAV